MSHKKVTADGGTYTVDDPQIIAGTVLTDNYTVVHPTDNGKTFLIGTDAKVVSLPATVAGLKLTFINVGAAGNNNVRIDPATADKIIGSTRRRAGTTADATTANGLHCVLGGADGKYIDNTKATTILGDHVTLIGDGVDGWYAEGLGIWTNE